jgi:hypothetical protein
MIHLKYECKVNFVKLPLIWIYRSLWPLENATAGRNTDCRSVVNPTHPDFPRTPSYRSSVEITRTLWWQTRFRGGRVREWKSGHNSVTVQNRMYVYMNFFDHKDLGNRLLKLCPKVVKHPVFPFNKYTKLFNINLHTYSVLLPNMCTLYQNWWLEKKIVGYVWVRVGP